MLLLSRIRIHGVSMEPSLLHGSYVLASAIPYLFSQPKPNDIVIAQLKNEKKYIIKRIGKVDQDIYFLVGDNSSNSLEVGWVERKQIMGKVIYLI